MSLMKRWLPKEEPKEPKEPEMQPPNEVPVDDDEPSPADVAAFAVLEGDDLTPEPTGVRGAVATVTSFMRKMTGQADEEPAPTAPSAFEAHALDEAPVNSKIVRTRESAVLATPERVVDLPKTDPASRLPEGARIAKRSEHRYEAEQLNAGVTLPMLVTTTAAEAIAGFVQHFHPPSDPDTNKAQRFVNP